MFMLPIALQVDFYHLQGLLEKTLKLTPSSRFKLCLVLEKPYTVKKNDGSYSQVDLVVVTELGIVEIEVKKYNGWIYGVGDRRNWVQVLAYGKEKHSLYNPIFQNDGHIRAIKNSIPNYLNVPFHSMIVFYGDCKLKKISNVPSDVLVVKANKSIDAFNDILLKSPSTNFYTEEVVSVLKKGVENGNDLEIKNKHVQNIKNILG